MSIHKEAELILRLYELRRDETMRKARDWCFREFHPDSIDDVMKVYAGERSAYLRMVSSYWDMAAALVNHGAIGLELFSETNGEYFVIYAKLEPFLADMRARLGPQYMMNLEKLVKATPNAETRLRLIRERMNAFRAQNARSS